MISGHFLYMSVYNFILINRCKINIKIIIGRITLVIYLLEILFHIKCF